MKCIQYSAIAQHKQRNEAEQSWGTKRCLCRVIFVFMRAFRSGNGTQINQIALPSNQFIDKHSLFQASLTNAPDNELDDDSES